MKNNDCIHQPVCKLTINGICPECEHFAPVNSEPAPAHNGEQAQKCTCGRPLFTRTYCNVCDNDE
jgi:hypothetical protein